MIETMKTNYLITNGTIIDPSKGNMYKANIIIRDGKIENIVERDYNLSEYEDEGFVTIDATNLFIGPGLCDTHVHFRDPGFTYKEDILTGAEAAKKGGYTHIVLMANTNPHVDNVETLRYVLDKGANTGIHINTCANVTMDMKGNELTDMDELLSEGAVGFTDDGVPILDKDICYEAMLKCGILGVPISFHEENPEYITNNGVNKGAASEHYNIGGSDRQAEIDMIRRDIELVRTIKKEKDIDVKAVIQHISTKEGVELVRAAKLEGLSIHAEATPHHFTLTEAAVIKYGTNAKMNPPLRTEEDRLAIIEGLADGSIDLIATDHAPHAKEEKDKPITEAPSGIIGLETAFSLAIRELIKPGILTYPELFNRMSTTPCELYSLSGGVIKKDVPADLIIFAPTEEWTVQENEIKSKSKNSPFMGTTLPGVIKYTISDGKIVWER